ncbi:hypothetical protein AXF42_Ash016199 [Apostasia shenzhenica]|uniref:Uncharacterized protein n=1 Tax=Apostasia shenzhenica TaxID=1088818 RepID=A0A2I0AEP8_9ASPA|nr:hypothetical protein AXF42_Ash016199 [Apostasia shenzhenica]
MYYHIPDSSPKQYKLITGDNDKLITGDNDKLEMASMSGILAKGEVVASTEEQDRVTPLRCSPRKLVDQLRS